MVFLGFLELKTVLPATKTLAPKSNNLFELSSVTPPSISINALDSESIIRFLSSATLLKVFSINFYPPNPGFTLIKHTRSMSLIIELSEDTGVCGFNATPALIPKLLIF